MRNELSCHLVDLTVLHTSVSLTLGYLQAFSEADARIAGRYNFSSQCRLLDGGIEPGWREIQRSIENAHSEKHVFGFTNFFWNRNANLELARRIRTLLPRALIVFGGNDVTNQGLSLLANGSPVDVIVNGEGEHVFTNLLASYADVGADFHSVPGLSFRDDGDEIVSTPSQPRIDDLDTIPSPFLRRAFSPRAVSGSLDITYEFSRGCPFKCAFCHWGAAIGTKTRRFSRERIRGDLDFIISNAGPVARIWMADANFGMTDADVETAYLLADLVRKHKKRIFLVTNWAKNTTKRVIEAATVLYRHGIITGVTLSAQSLNDEVLKIADRKNIPFEYYRQLQDQFRSLGIPTYTELIFGMPGESYESFLDGVARVISAGGTPVIHPLILLNNTAYNDPVSRRQHGIKSRLMRYMGHGVSDADILIGHDKLRYEDWLKGMGLRLAVPLFHCGLLKFVMGRVHVAGNIGYGQILNRLVEYCMKGPVRSHSLFARIFQHYMTAWDSPGGPEALATESAIVRETQFGDAHYRALIKVVLQDTDAAGTLIAELARVAGGRETCEHCPEFPAWVEYQKLLVTAMGQAAFGGSRDIETVLDASLLAEYAGYEVARDFGPHRRVRVRLGYRSLSADEFVFRILYGGIDTLQMFAKLEPETSSRIAAG